MTMLRIDLLQVADQRYQIQIEGVDYFLRVYYLPRTSSFYLDLEDADESPIQTGIRMVTGYALTAANKDPRRQYSGDFIALRFGGAGDSIFDIDDLGALVKLYYADRDELLAGLEPDAAEVLEVTPK